MLLSAFQLTQAADRLIDPKGEIEILDIQSSMLDLSGNSLVPKSISRSGLENAKVLSQVDNKFIPVVANGTLAVIDQVTHLALFYVIFMRPESVFVQILML